MKPIEFSKEDRAAITAKLRDYFARELDQELGQLPAEMLLDFIGKEIGGAFYNRGVALELMGDIRAAYESYLDAAAAAPDWSRPREALDRFQVHSLS